MDIHYLPAHVLADKIKDKEISSLELTQHYISRIEKYDGDINSVVVKIFEEAIESAKHADEAVSKSEQKSKKGTEGASGRELLARDRCPTRLAQKPLPWYRGDSVQARTGFNWLPVTGPGTGHRRHHHGQLGLAVWVLVLVYARLFPKIHGAPSRLLQQTSQF